jgi:uncharacterized repeat protein (TIGR01451 family)
MIIARHVKRTSLALLAVSSMGVLQNAYATGTDAGVSVTNRATVSYSVGTVTQAAIESSPTGNSTPGTNAGADTSFLVDRRIFMSVADITGAPATVPGALAVVRAFTVSNTSNATVGFSLVGTDVTTGDQFDLTGLTVRVDSAIQPNGSYTPGTYDSGTDTGTSIPALPEDNSVTVFIVGDIPNTAVNGNTAIVDLQATAIEPTGSTFGTPGAVITATAGADTAAVDTVLGDTGNNGVENDTNVYTVSSAALSVTKNVSIVSDPFNGTAINRKAIPGAVLEYAVVVANTGAVIADEVGVTDPIPANTTFATGAYSGEDIQISVSGGGTTTCTAAADTDGCSVAAGVLTVGGADRPSIPAGQSATVRFQVTIN